MGYCSYCGLQQRLLPWACPSCSTKYCSFTCMNYDKRDHAVSCMEEPMRKTFTKTYYNQTLHEVTSPTSPPIVAPTSTITSVPTEKYTALCRFFFQGKCTRGDSCPFTHEKVICEHFLRNCCKYGENCLKIHPEEVEEQQVVSRREREPVICTHYQLGRCRYGDACIKIHQDPSEHEDTEEEVTYREEQKVQEEEQQQVICEHFLRGKCDYGDNCFKSHVKPPLYKEPYGPKLVRAVQNFNNVKLNGLKTGRNNNNYPNSGGEDIFLSDSEDSDGGGKASNKIKKAEKKIKKPQKPRASPINLFEVLEVPNVDSEGSSSSDLDNVEVEEEPEELPRRNAKEKSQGIKLPVQVKEPLPSLSNAEKKRLKKEKKKAAAMEENLRKIECLKELGNNEFQEYHYSAAVKLFSDAIKLCGANNPMPALFNNRAAAYLMLDNHKAALSDGRKVVEHEPGNAKAHHRIVRCCIALGKVDEARASLQEISSFGLNEELQNMKQQLEQVETLQREAVNLAKKKKYGRAAEKLDLAMEYSSHSPTLITLKAQMLAMQKEVVKARQQLDLLDKKDPSAKTSQFHFVQGLCAYYEDDLDRAISGFGEAKKDLSEAVAWHDKATLVQNAFLAGKRAVKYAGGNYVTTKESLDSALKVDPDHKKLMSRLFFSRAQVNEKFDKVTEALEDCSSAINYDPTHHQAWCKRGVLNTSQDLFEEGVRDLKEANRLKPSLDYHTKLEDAKRRKERASKRKPTHYQVLCVDKKAPLDVIKKAYRAKAREFHPDKHANASSEEQAKMESKMKEIAAAHSCLSDSEKREVYDRKLDRIMRGGNSDTEDYDSDADDFSFDLDDFFANLFGRMFSASRGSGGRFRTARFTF